MMKSVAGVVFVCGAALAVAAQSPAPQKVEIVSVIGCLKEAAADNWTLVNATDPVPSIANAPSPKEMPAAPVAGKNQFKLIGVSEFNLPSHKDRTVMVRGLHIKATPMSRLNVTSVTTAFPTCAPPPPAK